MPKNKKVVDIQDVISLLNQSQKSNSNLQAIAKQVSIIEKAVAELNRLLSDGNSDEQEEASVQEKKPYTGKPRGRKPKAVSEAS